MENPLKGLKGNNRKVVIGVAVLGGGYVAWKWMNRSPSDSADSATVTSSTDADTAATGILGSNVGGSENAGNSSSTETSSVTTNDVWYDTAVTKLESTGWDGVAVQSALGDFVTGQKLTEDEAKIVRAAVGAMGGYPPGGPTTIVVIPGVTDSSKLAAPTGLKVTSTTDSAVNLSWNAVDGAKQYRVYRSGVAQNVAASGDTVAQVGGLEPGKSYTFYVAAGLEGEKMGPRSGGVVGKTGSKKLSAPGGLKVTAKGPTWVTLQWSATYPGKYVVQRLGGPTQESVDTSQKITGLTANHRYSFRVAAKNGATTGPWSGYVTVTTPKK